MVPKVSTGGDLGYAWGDLAWERRGWNTNKILNKGDLGVEWIFHIKLAKITQQLPGRYLNKFGLIYRYLAQNNESF